jgi:beta-lactam-binding protein with PASTA domain
LGAVFLLVACGSSDAPGAKVTPTTTVVTTVTTQPSQTQPSQAQSSQATPAQPSVQSGVVPDVVGMNHQLAQDTMQAAGFYFLTEEDATGQGRLLINDRNWTVVSQDPKGGTRAPADTKIVLRSKKIGE